MKTTRLTATGDDGKIYHVIKRTLARNVRSLSGRSATEGPSTYYLEDGLQLMTPYVDGFPDRFKLVHGDLVVTVQRYPMGIKGH